MSLELKRDEGIDRRPRVLIADDEVNIRRAISFILGKEFEVTAVESGDKAYETIQQGCDYDVVSLDLQMPGMSGIEALRAIKAHKPDVEVLIITANSDLDSAKEALKLGAYDYIDKPFKKKELRDAIRRGVERRSRVIASEEARERLEFVKAQLMQSEKFAALGQLIAGVAHELNNPLAAIMGYSELLLLSEHPSELTRDYLEKVKQSAELCKDIIQRLLSFSRKQEKKREFCQMNAIIENTLELKKHDFKKDGIQLVRDLAGRMPGTMAGISELQQVFLNMINNAHQAMKEHSRVRTLTVKSEFDHALIRIRFEDTGPGIPKENLQKIFEPLFTTKEEGKGTGLGLSICYEIVKAHEGSIYVASEPGKGASFVIELPIVEQRGQAAGMVSHPDRDWTAHHLLVLDKEESSRDVLTQMAKNLGHHVDVADNTLAGRQKILNGNYDVIISNLDMPELNGEQLYEFIKQVKPELASRIILVIGGIISDDIKESLEESDTPYIMKPFGTDDIQKALNKVLK